MIPEALEPLEQQFLLQSGEFIGAYKHIGADDQETLKIELISDEAVKTSEIEGEILNRDSVQSSLRHQFGLGAEAPGVKPAERGIVEDDGRPVSQLRRPLTDKTMFDWHTMLLSGTRRSRSSAAIARTRMRCRSSPVPFTSARSISKRRPRRVCPRNEALHRVVQRHRAGRHEPAAGADARRLAHLYFVCIHPFEDGNGRIGRALAEKSLAQNLGQPSLIALAYTIERKRKDYYAALERNNKDLEITDWLKYFANTVLEAQDNTIKRVDFYVAKAKFYEKLRGQLNERQEKVIARMFREGIDGFKGGLSAENYITISKTSRATATRDLQDLVEKGALTKTGELRHTRYRLKFWAFRGTKMPLFDEWCDNDGQQTGKRSLWTLTEKSRDGTLPRTPPVSASTPCAKHGQSARGEHAQAARRSPADSRDRTPRLDGAPPRSLHQRPIGLRSSSGSNSKPLNPGIDVTRQLGRCPY